MRWQPIGELKDRYDCWCLMLCAPELVDLDCNPLGMAPGYWQDGPLTEGGDEEGEWVAAGYCMTHDHFVNRSCNPTHFMRLEAPPNVSVVGGVTPPTGQLVPLSEVVAGLNRIQVQLAGREVRPEDWICDKGQEPTLEDATQMGHASAVFAAGAYMKALVNDLSGRFK